MSRRVPAFSCIGGFHCRVAHFQWRVFLDPSPPPRPFILVTTSPPSILKFMLQEWFFMHFAASLLTSARALDNIIPEFGLGFGFYGKGFISFMFFFRRLGDRASCRAIHRFFAQTPDTRHSYSQMLGGNKLTQDWLILLFWFCLVWDVVLIWFIHLDNFYLIRSSYCLFIINEK